MLYLVFVLTLFSLLVAAQNESVSTDDLSIDPNSVSTALRSSWCLGQTNNCPKICGGAFPNDCNRETLEWNCVCTDGSSPNISDYANTMPFYICEEWRSQCTAAHPDDLEGQMECQSVICGSKNASALASSSDDEDEDEDEDSSSSTSSDSSTATSSSDAETASETGAAIALSLAHNYGTATLVVALMATFGLVL